MKSRANDPMRTHHHQHPHRGLFSYTLYATVLLFPPLEFGEELVLQRTPQTLTLVGELEEDDDEDDLEDDEDEDDDDDDEADEEVEVLLKFEHRDKEYNLVRFLDPILLVGRQDPDNAERCLLLTAEESDKVMPRLEGLFLDFHMQDNPDGILP